MGTGNSAQLDMGHWLLRLIALIIDSIILGIVAWILVNFVFISLVFGGSLYWLWFGYGYSLVFPFILGILEVLYFVFLEVSWGGATVGKKIMGLKVQMANGNNVTFDKSFLRNISKIYPIFLFLDWLIAVLTPGSDPRQKYTDRIAGTTVVQMSQPFASMSSSTPAPSQ
jgi:uncharacterized RDD family membrane protein YckC